MAKVIMFAFGMFVGGMITASIIYMILEGGRK